LTSSASFSKELVEAFKIIKDNMAEKTQSIVHESNAYFQENTMVVLKVELLFSCIYYSTIYHPFDVYRQRKSGQTVAKQMLLSLNC
jgi:hypothetical protein